MKIRTLTLQSFRSYEGVTLNTDAARVLVAGVNGAGKSSIQEAIRWLVTNRCAVTDLRGSGVEHLQPNGASIVHVSGVVDPIGKMERTKQRGVLTLSVENVIGDPSVQQQAFLYKMDTTTDYLEASLTTEHFLRLHHADAKALVLKLLDVRVPYEGQEMTLDQIELRYQNAFQERKVMKAQARNTKMPDPVPPQEFPPIIAIDAQLAKLREELNARVQGVGVVEGKHQILQERLQRFEARVEHEDIDALTKALVDVENRIAELEAQHKNLSPLDPRDVATKLHILTSLHDAIEAFKPRNGCALDEHIECPQKAIVFTKRKRDIETEIAGLPPVGTARARTPLDDARQEHRTLSERLEIAKAAAKENRERDAECEALRTEIASLVLLTPEQKADVEMLRVRIRNGEDLWRKASAYFNQVERTEEQTLRKRELDAKVEELERLCVVLGPSGVRLEALGKAISTFTERINRFTVPFGWTVTFALDPWGVLINDRPILTYSESEQFRIGIAVQLAIAELSGLSFAIVDRLDMLDVENRKKATEMIMASPVGQVIVLSTREPNQPLPQSQPGLLVYRLGKQNGRTVVLEGGL